MKERVNFQSVAWALIFSVSFAISVFYLSRYSPPPPAALLIIALNALLFGVYAFKLIQNLSTLDEVQIRIHLEAVSLAFVLSLLLVMILGMTALVKDLPFDNVSFLYIFPALFFFYFIGLWISKRKYR